LSYGKSLDRTIGGIAGHHVAPRHFGARRSHDITQLILGLGEALVSAAFSRDLVQDECGNDFLFFFRKPCHFGKGFFEQSIHLDDRISAGFRR